jgi:hypothetical protein
LEKTCQEKNTLFSKKLCSYNRYITAIGRVAADCGEWLHKNKVIQVGIEVQQYILQEYINFVTNIMDTNN